MNDPYYSGITEIVTMYAESFQDNKEGFINFIKTCNSPLSIMSTFYSILVHEKEIEPLENLDQKAKQKLWDSTSEYESRDRRLKLCKSLYVIEKISK